MKKFLGILAGLIVAVGVFSVCAPVYAAEEVDASVENGKKIFQNFLDTTAFIENDETWQDYLEGQYGKDSGIMRPAFRNAYLKKLVGTKQEDYDMLSAYEAFIYGESYLVYVSMADPAGIISHSTPESHAYTATLLWSGTNAEEVKDAYIELTRWQYAYIAKNGYPYNLVTGKSYAEESGMVSVETEKEASLSVDSEVQKELGLTDDELDEIAEELQGETDLEESSKGRWFGVVILAVILAAILVIIIKKKSTNTVNKQ